MKQYALVLSALMIFSCAHADNGVIIESVTKPSQVIQISQYSNIYVQEIQSLLGSAIHKIAHAVPLNEDEARLIAKIEKVAENYRIRWGRNIGWSALMSILFNVQFFPLLGLLCLYDLYK